ncbi:MAG TPA: glycosyltransferase family 39 protein [Burkholderiales bacterium]|nr:glycosyltransferase family 39 protein [Burkholderiales bacterium]
MIGVEGGRDPMKVGATCYGWVAVLALAACLRFYGIDSEPLWLDEAYSWWDARQTLDDLWHLVPQCDPHPPLYAALLKLWMAVAGESAAAMRALGALVGVATTAVALLAGREISARAGWIAGLLTAVAPFQIEFAHEARPYSLVTLGTALVVLGTLRVLRTLRADINGRPGWIAMIAGLAIALWSNNTSVLLLAALATMALCLIIRDGQSRSIKPAMAMAAAAVAVIWLPYLPIYLMQAQGVASDFWIPRPDLWRVLNELRFVVGLGSYGVLGALALVWIAGLAALWRCGLRREMWLLACLVVLPVALNFLVSVTIKPIFLARALIGIAPPFGVGLAVAMASIDQRWLRRAAVGGLAALRVAAVIPLYTEVDRKEQWDDIANYIVGGVGREALVLLVPNELALPLGHALSVANANVAMRGVPVDFPAPGRAARYPSGKCTPSVVGQDLRPLAQALRDRRTVVIVTRRNNLYDPQESTQAMLRSIGMRLASTREFMPGYLRVQTFVGPRMTVGQGPWFP